MSENLHDYISKLNIFTYRLVDGSYIVTEELDFEDDDDIDIGIIFTTTPALISKSPNGYMLSDWLIVDSDEATQLMSSSIITRSEAPFDLKTNYSKFLIATKLRKHLDADEFDELMNEAFNNIDELDSMKPIEDTIKHKKRFDWKPELN